MNFDCDANLIRIEEFLTDIASLLASLIDIGCVTSLQVVLDIPLAENLHPVSASGLLGVGVTPNVIVPAVVRKGVGASHFEAVHHAEPLLDLDGPLAGLVVELGLASLAGGTKNVNGQQGDQKKSHVCYGVF